MPLGNRLSGTDRHRNSMMFVQLGGNLPKRHIGTKIGDDAL
jgi:hypothetical protein